MEHPHFSELKSQTPEQFFGRAGVDLSVRGDNKQTLLHQAVAFSRLEFIPILLAKGVPVDAQNRNGQTALHYAETFANREAIQLLLAAGASVAIEDKFGNNAAWTAALVALCEKYQS